jgi:TRAP-type C4-dicarboxylate transport system permease small subunit
VVPNKIIEITGKCVERLCQAMMVIMVILTSYVVFGRYVLNKTPGWGEELPLLCMVWFSLLSASLAVIDDSHIRIQLFDTILPKKIVKGLKIFFHLLNTLFAIFMTIYGIKLSILTKTSVMPGMGIPVAFLYMSVAVSGLALVLTLIGKWRDLF